jgi:DNA-binding response OmpR family regulator
MLGSHEIFLQNSGRILLVDDEDLLAWCIEIELCAMGFHVKTASCLKMARETLENFEPDLIICDQGLPDGSGTDFVKRLKRRVPVIMVTAFTPPKSEELTAVGIQKLLRKPFDLDVLTREVQQHLSPYARPVPNPCPGRPGAVLEE